MNKYLVIKLKKNEQNLPFRVQFFNLACLFVILYPTNFKTAELIGYNLDSSQC